VFRVSSAVAETDGKDRWFDCILPRSQQTKAFWLFAFSSTNLNLSPELPQRDWFEIE
tara:strand:+ start:323 stop:493 length:171 start_codon:yes stop_codon:yes gene_type:complete